MGDFYRNLLRNNAAFGTSGAAPEDQGRASEKARGGVEQDKAAPIASSSGRDKYAPKEPQWTEERIPESTALEKKPTPAGNTTALDLQQQGPGTRMGTEPSSSDGLVKPSGDAARPKDVEQQKQQQQEEQKKEVGGQGQRRNREDAVASARERYLARKRKAAEELR